MLSNQLLVEGGGPKEKGKNILRRGGLFQKGGLRPEVLRSKGHSGRATQKSQKKRKAKKVTERRGGCNEKRERKIPLPRYVHTSHKHYRKGRTEDKKVIVLITRGGGDKVSTLPQGISLWRLQRIWDHVPSSSPDGE